jgi:CRP-like cAMP-binding protein
VNLVEYKTGGKFNDIVQEQFNAVYGAEIYKRLSDEWLERLTKHMILVNCEQEEVLFRENDTSDFISYIVERDIEVARRRPDGEVVRMGGINKGMVVGMSVFDDYLQLATAIAQTPAALFTID